MLEDLRKKYEIEIAELKVNLSSNIPAPPVFKAPPPVKTAPKKGIPLQNAIAAKQLQPVSPRNEDHQPTDNNSAINVVEILAKALLTRRENLRDTLVINPGEQDDDDNISVDWDD